MSTNNYYYTFDNCYSKPINITDVSFSEHLTTNFYHSTVASVKDCENEALRNNSEFFLINDVSRSLNNIYTNCYIPKPDNTIINTSIFGISSEIIGRVLELFNGLFKTTTITNPYNIQTENIDTCNNLMYNNQFIDEFNKKCFKYLIDGGIYTPKKYYAYYRKPYLSFDNIDRMNSIKDPSHYTSGEFFESLSDYDELLKFNSSIPVPQYGSLTIAFEKYICSDSQADEAFFDGKLQELSANYTRLFTSLNAIKSDLSSINYINNYDDETLRSLNVNIVNKSRELNRLLTSGGANNGRLDDTTLLTYFKIVENSILLLLIICFIFYFTKKKQYKQT